MKLLDRSLMKNVQVSSCVVLPISHDDLPFIFTFASLFLTSVFHILSLYHQNMDSEDVVKFARIWLSPCPPQDGQTCCFLRLVLRFYVERVFSNYASSEPQQQRCSSALANAFVSIRRDIHKCVSLLSSLKMCFFFFFLMKSCHRL